MTTTLQPHEQRVIDEKAQLDDKRAKLLAFIQGGELFGLLDAEDQILLHNQLGAMNIYSAVLGQRIERFSGAAARAQQLQAAFADRVEPVGGEL